MKAITTEQKALIYRALLEFARKQENILDKHAFDTDVEADLIESQSILDQLDPLLCIFNKCRFGTSYLMDESTRNRIVTLFNSADSFYSTEKDYPTKAGGLMGHIQNIMGYMKIS